MCSSPNWGQLPALAISNIFQCLNHQDRLRASTACWHWRSTIFQPRFFKRIQFNVAREQNRKNSFFLEKLAHIVSEVKIAFDSCNLYDVEQAAEILYKLSKSSRLLSISILPKYATLVTPGSFCSEDEWDYVLKLFVQPLMSLLSRKNPPLQALDLGGSEILSLHAPDFLHCISKPQCLERLVLASVKQDPGHYALQLIEPALFEKCSSLQVLSLDYDSMCEELLHTLHLLPLRQLIVHVHGINEEDHFGLSENAWTSFRNSNPQTELHLTLMCAYEAVDMLHSHIFRRSMPLTHLKVLFCEKMNREALNYLSEHYNATLRSLVWVDSMRIEQYRNIMELVMHTDMDPLVMMAWRCKNLQEIIIHGYLLDPINLVGVSRLRGRELQLLEVSGVHFTIPSVRNPYIAEISAQLGKKWCPLHEKTLPPALRFYPVANEVRDQYILKYIRKDIME
ncbi:F-box only protein 33 [Anopheles nili]|uniref:F-box only protein 33 n=1 Tax=Anopheles nili TaxID=185578 RepID=UPI00237B3D99|nr:F-box only protein 33 [Anopheles nili]